MNMSEHQESEEFIPKEVYCQSCGKNLTHVGGDVTNTGRIYCHGISEDLYGCINKEIFQMLTQSNISRPKPIVANYLDSRDVQAAIQRGKLIQYNPLEIKVK